MRKIALLLVIVLVVSMLAVPTMAAEPRMVTIMPELTFDGTTAVCNVRCIGNLLTDSMEATITLYRGSIIVARWYASSSGYIFFEETATAMKGYTYKLAVDLVYNGEKLDRVYVTGTCN